jgi:HAD superfamily hydrolase (TIGR01509 family)
VPRDVLKGVLFDMDGTLVDTEGLWGDALAALGRRLGGELSAAARTAIVGTSVAAALSLVYADLGLQRTPSESHEDDLWVQDAVSEMLEGPLVWRPGARELLTAVCEAAVTTALVTSTPRRLAGPLLRQMNADVGMPAFDVTVCADEVPRNKPDPAPYRQAMATLGLDPAGCVAIEDSAVGVAAALAADVAVLGVPSIQSLPQTVGLVLRDSLVGLTLDDLVDVLTVRDEGLRAPRR